MIKMLINEEEVVSNKEFTISEEMLSTSSTILNNCYPKSWEDDKDYVSRFYYPKDYSKCKIYNNDELIFAGIVENSGNISLNPRYPKFCSLQILDFKTLLSEGETLDFVIDNKTVLEAIQMVVNAIADYGFILGEVKISGEDDIINAYSTLDKTAYDVFQYLSEVTQSRWKTRMIDENTVAIDFYDPVLMERGEDIEYTQEWFEENRIKDISFSYGTRDYRNKQTITSSQVYGNIDYEEEIIANGYDRNFTTQSTIGKLIAISVNGESKTIGTNDDKELGIDADIYYTPGTNTFESNEEQPIFSSGSIIILKYTPLVSGRQTVYNNDEVNRIATQTGRKGVISRYENRNDVLNSEELNKVAQTYIRYKGSAEVVLKIETENNNLYDIGQIVYFDSPINEIAQDYMVKKKEMRIITTENYQNIFYKYELTSSFNSENAINYFDNQRNKAYGNISTGDYITRNIDIENEALIVFSNLTVTEAGTGNNVLNSILNSPFVE